MKSNLDEELNCYQCKVRGDINFTSFQKHQRDVAPRIQIFGLPSDISKVGIKNLFLNVGPPRSINYAAKRKSAIVEFETMNLAELAVRDLNNKPPYKLRVFVIKSDNLEASQKDEKDSEFKGCINFTDGKIPFNKDHIKSLDIKALQGKIHPLFQEVDYEPSYKIHQKKYDFKIQYKNSISLGRGYYYMGDQDQFIGGLQKYSQMSDDSEQMFQGSGFCTNCNSFTRKTCSQCDSYYCSLYCLKSYKHRKECFDKTAESPQSVSSSKSTISVPLKSSCLVVISMFCTLKTLYIRRLDSGWDDKFCRLCNDVAETVMNNENELNEPLKIDDLYVARYYENLCYYRAKIISIDCDYARVFFVDFGNSQLTKISDIKFLPEFLKQIPVFATKVNLINIPYGTSADAIIYLNALTSENVPLILKYENSLSNGVTLVEKETGDIVNHKLIECILPSWKKDPLVLSKLGDILYFKFLENETLEPGKTYNLTLCHFELKEFEELGYFWMSDLDSDNFKYSKGEMRARISEYCEFLEDDSYLPRDNELCFAQSNGEWHRCVSLRNEGTTCLLFYVDVGKTVLIETKYIRRMISDFIEVPAQAIRCVFSNEKLGKGSELSAKISEVMKNFYGRVVSTLVKKFDGVDYSITIPEVEKLIDASVNDSA